MLRARTSRARRRSSSPAPPLRRRRREPGQPPRRRPKAHGHQDHGHGSQIQAQPSAVAPKTQPENQPAQPKAARTTAIRPRRSTQVPHGPAPTPQQSRWPAARPGHSPMQNTQRPFGPGPQSAAAGKPSSAAASASSAAKAQRPPRSRNRTTTTTTIITEAKRPVAIWEPIQAQGLACAGKPRSAICLPPSSG